MDVEWSGMEGIASKFFEIVAVEDLVVPTTDPEVVMISGK